MSLDAAERFFALLAIVAGLGAVLVLAARLIPGARPLLAELHPTTLWLAWVVAATSMFGSLYFSESAGFEPCHLCWYQRIAMYSLAIVLLVAAIRRDFRGARLYAAPLASIGLVISIYHRLIEANPGWESSGTCSLAVPCNTPYFHVFEIFTLAMMAMCGFAAILALVLLVPRSQFESELDSASELESASDPADEDDPTEDLVSR